MASLTSLSLNALKYLNTAWTIFGGRILVEVFGGTFSSLVGKVFSGIIFPGCMGEKKEEEKTTVRSIAIPSEFKNKIFFYSKKWPRCQGQNDQIPFHGKYLFLLKRKLE